MLTGSDALAINILDNGEITDYFNLPQDKQIQNIRTLGNYLTMEIWLRKIL